jgi:hypothetical protein
MTGERSTVLGALRVHLASWFERAFPAELGQPPRAAWPAENDEAIREARRRSIHDVTREQLGISHWSCHTHF